MQPQTDFQALLEKRLKQFIKNLHETPQMLEKVANDVMHQALQLEKDYPSQTQRLHEGAIELVDVMAKGASAIDLFLAHLKTQDLEKIAPGVFLQEVDDLPAIDPIKSNEVIELVVTGLEEIFAKDPELSFGEVFYENYLGEYIANIFQVSAIESLYDLPDLFQALKNLYEEEGQEIFYTLFSNVEETLKEDVRKNYYSFSYLKNKRP